MYIPLLSPNPSHALDFLITFSSIIHVFQLSEIIAELYAEIFKFTLYVPDFTHINSKFHKNSSSEIFVISIRSVPHNR